MNTSSSPLSPGRYCWHATWGGDTNYPAITGENNASAECFVVRTIGTDVRGRTRYQTADFDRFKKY